MINLKCLNKVSDAAMTGFLELFKECLPEGETLPKSYNEIQLEHQSSTETVSSHRPSASNDVLARVMGRDPPGHVRMFGRGVTPSFLWGSNSALKMIEEVKNEAEDQMEMMEKRVKAEMESQNAREFAIDNQQLLHGVGIDDVGDDIYDET
ncbi:hypothetical protein COLO4_19971 [Corchorus olitorius]|uniref:Uncharacterized protein n=1 Tax=Corchorus olitorius TaxID=93759 RepID=A0A1R3J2G5_9ROSI|nr:hypothetical protein COLO4_19971 [Corchorus olitorius]